MAITDSQKIDLLWKKIGFGKAKTDTNSNKKAPNDKIVWVIGDSFTDSIRPYINASFKEVRYIGHWGSKLKTLPKDLVDSAEKPYLILVVGVERSF